MDSLIVILSSVAAVITIVVFFTKINNFGQLVDRFRSSKSPRLLKEKKTDSKHDSKQIRKKAGNKKDWDEGHLINVLKRRWSYLENARKEAARLLGQLESEKAVKPLIQVFRKEKNSYIREEVVHSLAKIKSKNAVEPLIKILRKHKDSDVRCRAAYILGIIESEKAVETLIKALQKDRCSSVRNEAAKALGKIKSEKAVYPLILALKDSGYIRGEAANALGEIKSEKAVEPLIYVLFSDGITFFDIEDYKEVIEALSKINSEKAIELLMARPEYRDDKNRYRADEVLRRLKSQKVVEPLTKSMKDEEVLKF